MAPEHPCGFWPPLPLQLGHLCATPCGRHEIGGNLQETFYSTLPGPGVESIDLEISATEDKPVRAIGRHVDLLRDILPHIASHASLPLEYRHVIESFRGLVPLPRRFHVSGMFGHELLALLALAM